MRSRKSIVSFLIIACFTLAIMSEMAFAKSISLNPTDEAKLKKYYDQAEMLFLNKEYEKSLSYFLQIDSMLPKNSNIQYHIGVCYLNIKDEKSLAIPHLELAINDVSLSYKSSYKEVTSPIKTIYYLAHAYHLNLKLDDAIKYFSIYKSFLTKKDMLIIKDVDRQIEMCRNAQSLIKVPLAMKSEKAFNEGFGVKPDYVLYVSPDNAAIIYSIKTRGMIGTTEDYYLSIFRKETKKWDKPIKLELKADSSLIPKDINNDKRKIFISKNEGGDENLYCSSFINGKWSDFVKLNPMINSKASETHACVTYDGNALFFTSNREGGFGGYDIYKCEKLTTGEWSKPQNLGSKINTSYDEESPFILADGATLYYSSKGHNSIGGFDIFTSTLSDDGLWSESENLGYPVNTTDDDVYYFMSKDEKNAFYTTTTNTSEGKPLVYKILLSE